MKNPVDQIVSDALKLPPQARALLAEKLIESLDTADGEKLTPAWRTEVRRRCREIDQESVALREAEEAFARAHAALE